MKFIPGLAIAGVLATALVGCSKKEGPVVAGPEIYVTPVVQKDVPIYLEVVGQTKGSQDVDIRARVEGYLEKVAFTEGAFVKKGDLLYQIDPKPLEAALAQAKGNLATSQAKFEQATITVNRLKPLAEQQAVSQQELDNAFATQSAAKAQVDAGRAAAEKAALDLGYAHITSPIDGVVGTTLVKAGNLVGRSESTLLTTVSQVDPILFRAGISEADYLRIARVVGSSESARAERRQTPVQLLLADGTVHPYDGRLETVERAVDATTGTLAVQFTFPNPKQILRPGLYGRARTQIEVKSGALLVPQRAVQELQNLYNVAVVGSDNKVAIRTVKAGPRVDNLWVIEEGLKPGERVIVEGLQKVRDGMTVVATPMKEPTEGTADTGAATKSGE